MKTRMGPVITLLLAAVAGLGIGDTPARANEKSVALTVEGEIVDLACYLNHNGKGKDHKGCAENCLTEGRSPVGLLTNDGRVYLLIEDHKKRDLYLAARTKPAERVSITGDLRAKGGVQALAIQQIK